MTALEIKVIKQVHEKRVIKEHREHREHWLLQKELKTLAFLLDPLYLFILTKIFGNQLTSIPPKIIRKPMVSGETKLYNSRKFA